MDCRKHPKYTARQKPRNGCLNCWYSYLGINTEKDTFTRDDLLKIISDNLDLFDEVRRFLFEVECLNEYGKNIEKELPIT